MAYKLLLVGDRGTGKTTYITRHLTGEFTREYIPTLGVEIKPLSFYVRSGKIHASSDFTFNIWDIAGQPSFGDAHYAAYVNADCAIVFLDLTSSASATNLQKWINGIKQVAGDIPIVICGNKCDVRELQVSPRKIIKIKGDHQYYEISAKSNYNFEKPFLYLARKLTDDPNLEIIANE